MKEFQSYRIRERTDQARWILVGSFLLLIGAFFRTQVLEHERFRLRAENNRLRPVPMAPARGTIFDRNGRVIAETVPGYSVSLLASSEDSLLGTLARFRRLVPVDSADLDEVLERYRLARYQPALVLGNATIAQVSRLEEHRANLPGLVIQSEPRRIYPSGRAVGHLVGYIGEVKEEELEQNRFAGTRLGSLVGRAGLEQEYDDSLRGSPGIRYIEVDARGRLVREEGAAPPLLPTGGTPIHTTLDLPLQTYIDSIWPPGQSGAMIAMTPKGEIRALYSTPSYDPNDFIGGVSAAEWHALNTDPALPLLNRALQVRYPPGSPFKLATAAMALRRGIVDFNSRMPEPCRGGIQFGNRYFKCWDKAGHGSLDLTGAIAQSCDVYFYQLGLRLGLTPILEDGVLMGFKDRSGIDLVNEVNPIYPSSTAYYDRLYGPRGWSSAVVLNLAIGQGENTQTLMNMVRFYGALAGDGTFPHPYLVHADPSERTAKLGLSLVQLEGLRRALIAVVERGTAARSRMTDLSVAGKTGTAQNPHGKDHGWFIAFAPAEKPEIVVGAIFEFGGHGTVVAPYVVRAIRRYLLGPDTAAARVEVRVVAPEDSAPREQPIRPDTITGFDSTVLVPKIEP
jgi:penicillin-binding protein 2